MFGGVVGFSSSKVKTALKLLAGRINLVSNKKKAALRLLNAEVAGLLAANKHDSARIRVEAVLREERLLAAWELLSLFLELLSQRLSNLERSRALPSELREAVTSAVFMSSRCGADLPELLTLRSEFGAKFGNDFVHACCADNRLTQVHVGVNERLLQLMTTAPPPAALKLTRLEEIAVAHRVPYDAEAARASLLPAAPILVSEPVRKEPARASPSAPAPSTGGFFGRRVSGAAAAASPPPPPPPSDGFSSPPTGEKTPPGMAAAQEQELFHDAASAARSAQRAADHAVAAAAAAARFASPGGVSAAASPSPSLGGIVLSPSAAALAAEEEAEEAQIEEEVQAVVAAAEAAVAAGGEEEANLPSTPATLPEAIPPMSPLPPSAPPADDDSFADLAARFEALKRAR